MMWPILTKVQYERFPVIFSSAQIWKHIAWSLLINWVIAPFVMLGIAFATLPDQPTFRDGVLLVGIARCIAMVMIWSTLAGGDTNYCAILVIINSLLQMVLFSPMSLLFINVISKGSIKLQYGKTAIDVLIYLGIPLAAGVITRFAMRALLGEKRFEGPFLTWFSPLALLGLLYTIILICMQQATRILSHIGIVFRVMVPLALYFAVMWSLTFALFNWLSRKRGIAAGYDYDKAVVQSFTAASNNFELAIAVAVAVFGVGSDQALAATLGPMVEVPVLLALTYVSVWFKRRLRWGTKAENEAAVAAGAQPPV
ncbi:hypothetical protein VHUM_03619 [Vanrija humicola]|uniref:Arsenical-resistance protein n=1 Tax=Vanrija humicola TaxID=5417 RepID=A0A7D8Z1M3_VANHU|nr:hypothetical protein VHUM_03619 [Vanrija humicola]